MARRTDTNEKRRKPMASFSIPLTGLEADSTALNTIANDLSNMNTTAFKAETTNFSDLFYQQIGSTGSGDPIQVGAGVAVASNEIAFTQGSINSTGNSTDAALNGNGFFIVSNGNGGYEYTRAGAFTQDTNGNLLAENGMSVMGYPAPGGVVNTNAPLTAINVPLVGQVQQPQASTTMSMTANLDSTTTAGTQFPAEVTVYDSLGEPHVATVTYEPGAAANTWTYSVSLPAADYSAAGGDTAPAAITGTMTFDQNGNLIQVQPMGQANPSNVGTGAGDVSSIDLNFNPAATNVLADGAAGLDIKWNLLGSGGTPNISQVDTASAVSGTNANGYTSGTFQSFTINSDGTVAATYSNGQTQTVGQIALANVTNLQGLQLLGDGDYATTLASGTASIGAAGTSGLATIEDDALEASNVNISSEFSDLIVAQRAFEANAKSVTTFDQVTEDTINMVH
jgi:flagellar hook protein FlgE